MIEIDKAIAALSAEQQREWTATHDGHVGDGCALIAQWTPEARRAVEVALHDYALASNDARGVLGEIARWSRRLGVALACVVAREALRYVPEGELRPLRAIETAERWTRGEATVEECRQAASAASSAYAASAAAYAANAANAAAYADADAAAANAAYAASYTADASADAASAVAENSSAVDGDWTRARDAELRRLCIVVGESLRTGAVSEWMG